MIVAFVEIGFLQKIVIALPTRLRYVVLAKQISTVPGSNESEVIFMASIRKRGSSYLIVVSMGYDYNGNRIKPQQKTVHPPEDLTPR